MKTPSTLDLLHRLARSIGSPLDDRPPDPESRAIATGTVVASRTGNKPKRAGRRGVPVSLGWRKQVSS